MCPHGYHHNGFIHCCRQKTKNKKMPSENIAYFAQDVIIYVFLLTLVKNVLHRSSF